MRLTRLLFSLIASLSIGSAGISQAAEKPLVPTLTGEWWQVAGDPDLGELTSEKQQPVDFGIWPAADGTWQLWSCIRKTKEPGNTRLFHRWEGAKLTDKDWTPKGIAWRAETRLGETAGGMQAPYVLKDGGHFFMYYGDWKNICVATSTDGKKFLRRVNDDFRTGMFNEGETANTRDPMVLKIGDLWYCYYTAHPERKGSVYCRTSKDTVTWSEPKIVATGGAAAGEGPYSAECPFVVEQKPGVYYLFRTQHYGTTAQTSVYCSNDPLNFGVNDDRYFVTRMAVAAPEVFQHEGQWYMAALLPSLKGIEISKLTWLPAKESGR